MKLVHGNVLDAGNPNDDFADGQRQKNAERDKGDSANCLSRYLGDFHI
jgi:hypothetical protein